MRGSAGPERQIDSKLLWSELEFSSSRSSGPGGQNVNKVNSKVLLKWDVRRSAILTAEEKDLILQKLHSRITASGVLVLSMQESRSQLRNKEDVIAKLDFLLKKAFEKRKVRKKSKPSKAHAKKRLESKRRHSEKKAWRRKL